ncbi:MAG: precorrin-2 C(20)-methyltransferase [Methylococcales bacterium]
MSHSIGSKLGVFWGIGVGPGPQGYLPLAALDAITQADLIFSPRARNSKTSVALQCLVGIDIPSQKLREIEFIMDPNRSILHSHYAQLADTIAAELKSGLNIAYLTIGDSLTYSTYGYVLTALLERLPELPHRTFPGITSYAAAASALDWPLGEGKERMLILPCPDQPEALQQDIENHDVVVLMKIGKRLDWVLELLREMNIARYCAFARRIGLSDELLVNNIASLQAKESTGYLSTLLIRKASREKRH